MSKDKNDIVDNQDETYYLGIMVVSKKKNNKPPQRHDLDER